MAKKVKPKAFELKPAKRTALPSNWALIISDLKKLHDRYRKLFRDGETPTWRKSWIKLFQDLETVTSNIQVGGDTLHYYTLLNKKLYETVYQVGKIVDDLRGPFPNLIKCILIHGRCDVDLLDSITNRRFSREELQSLLDQELAELGVTEFTLDSVSTLLGGMQYHLDNIKELIDHLLLLFSAVQHYETKTIKLAKIGPCDVFLSSGPFDALPGRLVDHIINMALDGVKSVLEHFKAAGVPDFALAGPISLELGLPPLPYGGTYSPDNNLVRVCLRDVDNVFLSTDYELEKTKRLQRRSAHGEVYRIVFGQKRPQTYYDTPSYFTIAHELAHRIYYRGLRPNARETWEAIFASTLGGAQISEYFEHSERASRHASRIADLKKIDAPTTIINQIGELWEASLEKQDIVYSRLSEAQKDIIQAIETSPFRAVIRPEAFSGIKWPTQYARVNEFEAFAEALIMVLWEPYDIRRYRRPENLTPQEWQAFRDLMFYFIKSLRKSKV